LEIRWKSQLSTAIKLLPVLKEEGKMYYDELLRLCAYEPEEIERERPRIEKAFDKLELTPEDIDRGVKRVSQYFDIELTSIRKMMGLWLKSLIDLVLAREEREKIIYCAAPPFPQLANAMVMVSKDIFVTSPEVTVSQTVGGIFDRLNPVLEAAEGDLLPAGLAYCSGLQVRLGGIIKGIIPVPDLLVSSGFVCDETPKLDELVSKRYGVPVAYVDGVHDEMEERWPRVSDTRIKYIAQEVRDALVKFEEVTGYKVTEEVSRRATERSADLLERGNRVLALIRSADPAPISFVDMGIAFRLLTRVSNTTTVSTDTGALVDLLYSELKERVDRGEGVLPKGAPRIAMGLPWTEPSGARVIDEAGLTVIVDMSTTTELERGPIKYEDYWERSAEATLRFCGIKFASRFKQLCKEWEVDGAILNFPIGCRDLCIAPVKSRDSIMKELGIPVLLLESDHIDVRDYSAEAMRSRVEAFAEMLIAAKAAEQK
jgi:benzoyl-CoA reductase/2-hydroxyglutaryl-CoA dehydratase subunit BcrC/BadD/HgdB